MLQAHTRRRRHTDRQSGSRSVSLTHGLESCVPIRQPVSQERRGQTERQASVRWIEGLALSDKDTWTRDRQQQQQQQQQEEEEGVTWALDWRHATSYCRGPLLPPLYALPLRPASLLLDPFPLPESATASDRRPDPPPTRMHAKPLPDCHPINIARRLSNATMRLDRRCLTRSTSRDAAHAQREERKNSICNSTAQLDSPSLNSFARRLLLMKGALPIAKHREASRQEISRTDRVDRLTTAADKANVRRKLLD